MMKYIVIALLILLVIVTLSRWHFNEKFQDCDRCSLGPPPQNPSAGYTVLNPFIWPYSATGCVDNMYQESLNLSANVFGRGPLTQSFEPDHVLLTN